MGEKLTPAVKKVGRADGVKQGSANTTLTTPNIKTDGSAPWNRESGTKEKIF